MSFKLFWKKTNRGLWLGLALLIALILFIIISEVNFGLQKKEIRATTKEYVEALLSINLVEGDLGADGYLTEAQKTAQKEMLDRIAKDFWYSGSIDLNSRNYDLSRLNEILTQWQREVPGKVTAISYQPEAWDISITRDGPGRVLVSATIENVELRGEGAAPKEGSEDTGLFPTSTYGRAIFQEEEETGGEWSCTCRAAFSLELIRKNGKWLVAGMNADAGYGYYYGYGLLGMLS